MPPRRKRTTPAEQLEEELGLEEVPSEDEFEPSDAETSDEDPILGPPSPAREMLR